MFRILVVCTGNVCRSPMAEGILRKLLEENGLKDRTEVRSAGTWAAWGSAASANAVTIAEKSGVKIADHRSTPLTPALIEGADLVLGMEPEHVREAHDQAPDSAAKVHLLTTFSDPENGNPMGVEDPIGGDEAEYEKTFRQLDRLLRDSLPRIQEAMTERPETPPVDPR